MDKDLIEQISNPDLDHLDLAETEGIYEPLAAYIEAGGTLHANTRAWLAKLLRGELPKKKSGQKRTHAQKLADYRLLKNVQDIMQKNSCTENAAIEKYCYNKYIMKDSVKTSLRRAKQLFGL